jgi:hypothetical protein
MTFDASIRTDVPYNGGSISAVRNFSGDAQIALDTVIAPAASNQLFTLAIDVSQVKMLVMLAENAMTIRTNSSGSPANTVNLLAGVPYEFGQGGYETLILTTDVTAIFVTSTLGGRLRILAILDL